MYACGYKLGTDTFYDFLSENIDYGINLTSLLPTKEIAELIIEETLGDDFFPIEIQDIIVKANGISTYEYDTPEEWQDEDFDEKEE